MKKEYFALGLLLLVLLGNLWNQRQLDTLTSDLDSLVEAAYASSIAQEWQTAAAITGKAESIWLDAHNYTHIFIRHTDIDAMTAAFCGYRGAIEGQDKGDVAGSYLLLKAMLDSLRDMERLSAGSIL